MGDRTGIEWTRGDDGSPGATWTPVRARNRSTGKVGWHCEHASPGCAHCYSESFNERRLGTGLPFKPGHRADVEHFLDETMLLAPLRWRRPRKIFVCSMTDLFGDWVPDAWIDRIFAVMALAPQHTFQVLTKRSARMRAYLSAARAHPVGLETMDLTLHEMARNPRSDIGRGCILQGDICHLKVWPLPNVWLGVSAEDQRRADERVPDLSSTPAAVRFLSAEPLLGRVDLTRIRCPNLCSPPDYCNRCHPDGGMATGTFDALADGGIELVIVGGESGPSARPMHVDWAREIRDACAAVQVPFFFKQWGEWAPEMLAARHCWPDDRWHEWAAGASHLTWPAAAIRVGKKAAGRLLDGVEHNGMPTFSPSAPNQTGSAP